VCKREREREMCRISGIECEANQLNGTGSRREAQDANGR